MKKRVLFPRFLTSFATRGVCRSRDRGNGSIVVTSCASATLGWWFCGIIRRPCDVGPVPDAGSAARLSWSEGTRPVSADSLQSIAANSSDETTRRFHDPRSMLADRTSIADIDEHAPPPCRKAERVVQLRKNGARTVASTSRVSASKRSQVNVEAAA